MLFRSLSHGRGHEFKSRTAHHPFPRTNVSGEVDCQEYPKGKDVLRSLGEGGRFVRNSPRFELPPPVISSQTLVWGSALAKVGLRRYFPPQTQVCGSTPANAGVRRYFPPHRTRQKTLAERQVKHTKALHNTKTTSARLGEPQKALHNTKTPLHGPIKHTKARYNEKKRPMEPPAQ